MNETFTFNLWETVDYLNIIKSDIKDHLQTDAINEAICDYQKLWAIADLGIYAIPDIEGKKEFLHLVETAAADVKNEIRKAQQKDFNFLEDEVRMRMNQTEECDRMDKEFCHRQHKINVILAELRG